MKHLVALFLLTSSLLATSPGTPMELKMPTGTADLSPGAQAVAMNDSFILVGVMSASYAPSGGGAVVQGAGEVLVFSASTGAFVRRLRSPEPVASGMLGRYVAIQGSRAYAVDLNSRVCCFDISTGKRLWTNQPSVDSTFGGLTLKSGIIEYLAVEGDYVLAGIPNGWLLDSPSLGFELNQGILSRMSSLTGATASGMVATGAEAQASFAASATRSVGMTVIGEPRRDYNSIANSGVVNIYLDNNQRYYLALPGTAAEDRFGTAVGLMRERLLVSAPGRDVNGRQDVGTVLVIDRATNAVIKNLDAPTVLPTGAAFGSTISVHGSLAVIGATGSCWLYDAVADKLIPLSPPALASSQYGKSSAINSTSTVVADPAATGGSASKGRVYLFQNYSRELPAGSVIASTKTAAPGTATGVVFTGFRETAVSPAGKVMFTGSLSGGGATSATNSGLWSNLGGSLDLVLREGEVVGDRRMASPSRPLFAPDGSGRFLVRQTSTLRQNLFIDNGTSATYSMAEGDQLTVNGSLLTISKIHDYVGRTQASSQALVAYSAKTGTPSVTAQNDSRIGRKTPSFILDEAREGVSAAGLGITYGQIAPRIASSGGRMVFVAAVAGASTATNSALITKNIGIADEAIIARKGDYAPGAGAAKFSSFVGESLNASEVIFRATLTGGTGGATSGVWRATIFSGPMVHCQLVALRGQQAPGFPTGVKFTRFFETFIADGGTILFRAQTGGAGIKTSNDIGIWVCSQNKVFLLLREGDFVPGGRGVRIGAIQRLDLAGSSQYAVLTSLTGTSSARNQAILTGHFLHADSSYWTPQLVLQKGSLVDRSSPMQVKGLKMAGNHIHACGAGSRGIARQVAADGVLFSAVYSSGTDLLFLNP